MEEMPREAGLAPLLSPIAFAQGLVRSPVGGRLRRRSSSSARLAARGRSPSPPARRSSPALQEDFMERVVSRLEDLSHRMAHLENR